MLSPADLVHLPYTPDLTEGGIAYALHSLPSMYHRKGGSVYDHLRRSVAAAAVELAFRRYLSKQGVPFEVKSALPFTDPDRYDVVLGGRRCEIKSFLIRHRDQAAQLKHNPQMLLEAPALVASDLHAGDGHSSHDLYVFAFLPGLVATSPNELQKVIETNRPYYLVHGMPEPWSRPVKWNPLGRLALKSDAEERITVEIGGQDQGRAMRSCTVELPPRTRLEVDGGFFSLSFVHIKSRSSARLGIHSAARGETHLIDASHWENLWIYGVDVLLAGYMSREEFSRRASFIQAGSHVFQYDHTHVKNLAVPVSDLKPLSELLARAKAWSH